MRRRFLWVALAIAMVWPTAALAQGKGRPASQVPASQTGATEDAPSLPPGTTPRSRPTAVSGSAESAGVPEYQSPGATADRSLLWDSARMVFSLAVVLVVLGVGVKIVRRWPGFAQRETAAGPLQILGRLPLTTKEAVCLVRAGSEVLVVGVSPAGVTLLHRLEAGVAETLRPGGGIFGLTRRPAGRVPVRGTVARAHGADPRGPNRVGHWSGRFRGETMNRRWALGLSAALALAGCLVILGPAAEAAGTSGLALPTISVGVGEVKGPQELSSALQIMLLLTVLALAPSLIILLTSFSRIVIVLGLLRQALGTPQMPPNQVLIGLALFLTAFIMAPVALEIRDTAYTPVHEPTDQPR